ncbi:helix-turn-helix domain-containing protein [Acetonema longum]|uniref:HTH cro/C1-type domain-containing protein n=1 Tax=Acetonema longum DSM 6540 TaxID=1009370 RepID=F7NPG4_9FIRM|nr:helix-turn-helix transcriptional regulator [Acetonema longum]EGO62126.1 hypothetical protein ALO_20047 [Acetonema longum DSM 6540]
MQGKSVFPVLVINLVLFRAWLRHSKIKLAEQNGKFPLKNLVAQRKVAMFTFSENLKNIMTIRGVNQKWLANATNTTEATISRYINKVHKPNSKLIVKIAEALDVSVDCLLGATTVIQISNDIKESSILTACYAKSTDRDKKLIWGILEDYLTLDEKAAIAQYFSDNKKSSGSA